MVSIIQALSAGAVLAVAALAPNANALEVGEFYKPSGAEVSGALDATTTYRRSPCPALNTLANHGYLPRDGLNISKAEFAEALLDVFNIGADISAVLLSFLPAYTDLNYLATHGLLEHDASLIHSDTYFAQDPAAVNSTLALDLLDRALGNANTSLGVNELAATRVDRLAECKANNPQCTFGSTQVTIAFLESSILLLGLGGNNNNEISYDHAQSFLVEEKIPDDFAASATTLTVTQAKTLSAEIYAAAASL